MSKIWVIVADEAKVRFFFADKPVGSIVEIHSFSLAEAQLLEQDLVSDRPGRGSNHIDSGKHTVEGKSDPKEQYSIQFAKQVSEYLDKSLHAQAYKRLLIIAAPHFLGLLRKELSRQVAETVTLEVDKDLTKMEATKIRELLPKYL